MARALFLLIGIGLNLGLVVGPGPATFAVTDRFLLNGPTRAQKERTVFLGCNLTAEDVVPFTAAVAASGHPGVVLLDSAGTRPYLQGFWDAFQPKQIIPVGSLDEESEDLEGWLGRKTEPILEWHEGPPTALWKALFHNPRRVVVCPAEPRPALLQAACLAGVIAAPLYVIRGGPGEAAGLRSQLVRWHTHEVFAVADTAKYLRDLPKVHVIPLTDEQAVARCYLRRQLQRGPIDTLVVANPHDVKKKRGEMSSLAPWIALQKRAALLLTNEAGDNTEALIETALQNPRLRSAESLIIVANLQAIPPERRPNPVPGKDALIEMEPFTPTDTGPFSFATGRLFHRDNGLVTLLLARQRLLATQKAASKVMVVSNPGGGLPLLETFSRHTAKEFRNLGYQTTTLFGKEVAQEKVRRQLPEQDIFLWEGHHSVLTRDFGLPDWPEPLKPSLIFLQSCLALCEADVYPLLQRGAVGVVGSSTRTYSASGGACSLAFFDALLYENQSLGGALRQAKNFLLAYSLLKQKRLGSDAKLQGANLRSAWAFTLWGDPTLKLPRPDNPAHPLPMVRHEVHGKTITLCQPEQAYETVTSENYQARMFPNGRLAGLLHKDVKSSDRRLAPFLFAEVRLSKVPAGRTPRLRSRLPSDHWVFCWDARLRRGYLLITPRAKDRGELRFHIEWEADKTVVNGSASKMGGTP
jgi:hypothetical protein